MATIHTNQCVYVRCKMVQNTGKNNRDFFWVFINVSLIWVGIFMLPICMKTYSSNKSNLKPIQCQTYPKFFSKKNYDILSYNNNYFANSVFMSYKKTRF